MVVTPNGGLVAPLSPLGHTPGAGPVGHTPGVGDAPCGLPWCYKATGGPPTGESGCPSQTTATESHSENTHILIEKLNTKDKTLINVVVGAPGKRRYVRAVR